MAMTASDTCRVPVAALSLRRAARAWIVPIGASIASQARSGDEAAQRLREAYNADSASNDAAADAAAVDGFLCSLLAYADPVLSHLAQETGGWSDARIAADAPVAGPGVPDRLGVALGLRTLTQIVAAWVQAREDQIMVAKAGNDAAAARLYGAYSAHRDGGWPVRDDRLVKALADWCDPRLSDLVGYAQV